MKSDFPEPDSLEAEGFNEIMEKYFTEEKIQEEVVACIKDLIDNVEKAEVSPQKKPLFKISPINKAGWKVSQRKKVHQSGLEYANSNGKLLVRKKIIPKKDCTTKFSCARKIGKETV